MANVKSQISNVKTSNTDKSVKCKISNVDTKKTKEDYENRIYTYVLRLIKFLRVLSTDTVSREIIRQVIRSGSSVGANYFEARSASSRKDYINFFSHSLKSANEIKFWLNILHDGNYVSDKLLPEVVWLKRETEELARIIASSIVTLKKKDN